jgi:hypothetical protein
MDEYRSRLHAERRKARRKYGDAGLEPKGNMDLDALDYAINEVVGLYRYGEILFNRREDFPPEFRLRAAKLASTLKQFSAEMGGELISLQQGLECRMDLGKKETSE